MNGLTGGLTLFAGSNVNLVASSKGITLNAIGGVTAVNGQTGNVVLYLDSLLDSSISLKPFEISEEVEDYQAFVFNPTVPPDGAWKPDYIVNAINGIR